MIASSKTRKMVKVKANYRIRIVSYWRMLATGMITTTAITGITTNKI